MLAKRITASVRLAALLVVAVGCGSNSVSSAGDCPSYTVAVDGGATGFSKVGEVRSDSLCSKYCAPDYPVCELLSASSVKCQKGCS